MLSVVFYHAGLRFPGGYVGVDIFFVISGYLITELILKQLATDEFNLLEFCIRRIRRIFPAFFVVVLLSMVAGSILLFPMDLQSLGQSVVAQTALAANFYFWQHTGYFFGSPELLPLLHTWSLAVEEQFYLFFPFLLLATKRLSRRWRIATAVAIALASLGLSIHGSYYYPEAAFFLLPSRAWELLLGGLLAMIPPTPMPRWQGELFSWAGLAGIAFALVFYTRGTRFPGLAAVPPCAGAALLIWANGNSRTLAGKILAWPPVVFIGLISYSLYLWHWPLIVFTKYWTFGELTHLQRLVIVGVSILLATISWKWIETPFRRRVWFKGRREILTAAGGAVALLLAAGLLLNGTGGLPSRFSPKVLTYLKGIDDHGIQPQLTLNDALRGEFVKLGDPKDTTHPPRLFLWGDSHAMAILPAVDALCLEHGVTGRAATHSATAPLLGFESNFGTALLWDSIPYNEAVLRYIREQRIPNVLIVAMWANYAAPHRQMHDCLIATIREVRLAGARVWVMRQVPLPNEDVPRALARYEVLDPKHSADLNFPEDAWRNVSRIDDQIFAGASAAGATILNPDPLLTDAQGRMLIEENDQPLYSDGAHLSITGAMKLRPMLEPIFDRPESVPPPRGN